MIPTRLIVLSFFIILTGLFTTSANAARWHPGQIVHCNMRGCSDDWMAYRQEMVHNHYRKSHRKFSSHHHAHVAFKHEKRPVASLGVNKPQEYVAPDHPGDKLVMRETYEAAHGIVRSHKTGATAHVSPKYAAVFQKYVNDLEAAGASIYYMGGYRHGTCSVGSQHPCGKALDICQDSRGHVSGLRDCHLPPPSTMKAIAHADHLTEGSMWCHQDYGHVQITPSGSDCGAKGYVGDGHRHYYLATMVGTIE